MNTKSYLLVVLLACIATIGVNAQGVKIYKNRGSMQTINYNMLDSIVAYEKAETEATGSGNTPKQYFSDSELLLNDTGSIYHLSLKPEQLADNIILVGDIGRVPLVAENFESIDCDIQHREFHSITGYYKGKRVTVISSGIGCDNMDIVVNELDALANIDLDKKLKELKNIIIKYLPSDEMHNNQLTATLYDIYNNEDWLTQHSEVEDHIFIPAIRRLEQKTKQNDVSVKISNMISKAPSNEEALSDREKDVIISLVQGMSNKEIADHLCISTNTVITHRRNIARKLQIHSPAGLTIYAIVNNLVDLSSVKL